MVVSAQELTFKSPDNRTVVNFKLDGGIACYSVSYDGKIMLDESPLGLVTNTGDFTKGLVYDGYKTNTCVDCKAKITLTIPKDPAAHI